MVERENWFKEKVAEVEYFKITTVQNYNIATFFDNESIDVPWAEREFQKGTMKQYEK
jgi:hypothetical protein